MSVEWSDDQRLAAVWALRVASEQARRNGITSSMSPAVVREAWLRAFAEEIAQGNLHRLGPAGGFHEVGEAVAAEVIGHRDLTLSDASDVGNPVDIETDDGKGSHGADSSGVGR